MEIKQVAKKLKEKGANLYLVGGAVRDSFLGKAGADEDYCVTGITEEEFQHIFPEAQVIGKSFAVFVMDKKEFALARKETKSGSGHKDFEIKTGKEITIQEDLARRDVTINSMAKEVLTGEIIDPFQGRQDLEQKRLRATTKAFAEDPLRVYRVARFAAQLGFAVEEETLLLMKQLKEELNTLSKERVFIEFKKALQTDQPSIFFEVLKKAGVLAVHFPEVANLIGSVQPVKYHPEGDAYVHTLLVLDNCAKQTQDVVIRFCGLVHDLGKGNTPKEIYPHHYGHEDRGVDLVNSLAKRIGVPKTWRQCGQTAAKEHMKGGYFQKLTPAKKVAFLERVDRSLLGLEGLQVVVEADKTGRGKQYREKEETKQKRQFIEIAKQCITEVTGKGVKQKYPNLSGKALGDVLHEERVQWMQKQEENRRKDCNTKDLSV